jgi:hypothetical protein
MGKADNQVIGANADIVIDTAREILRSMPQPFSGEMVMEALIQKELSQNELIAIAYLLGCLVTEENNSYRLDKIARLQ